MNRVDKLPQTIDKTAMRLPPFMQETLVQAKESPAWGIAFMGALLLPIMLIFARAGIEICCGMIALPFLWQCWRTKQWAWLQTPFALVALVAWLWLLLVVTPLAVSPPSGLLVAAVWFRMPLMFCALRYWVLAKPAARTTLGVLLGAVLALIALDCYVQFVTGMSLSGHPIPQLHRLSGPFRGPKVGYFLAMMGLPGVALLVLTPFKRAATMGLGLLVMLFAAVVLSGERSAFLSMLLAGGMVAGLLMLMEKRLRLRCIGALLAAFVVLAMLYAMNHAVQVRAAQMAEVMQHYWQSDYGLLASTGIAMGEAHWLHGVGITGFSALCPTLMYGDVAFRGLHPHNYYIEWFAESGIVGLVLFIGMLVCLARDGVQQLRRSDGTVRLAAVIALGVMLQHFFPIIGTQSFFGNWSAVLQWYGLGLVFAAVPRRVTLSPG